MFQFQKLYCRGMQFIHHRWTAKYNLSIRRHIISSLTNFCVLHTWKVLQTIFQLKLKPETFFKKKKKENRKLFNPFFISSADTPSTNRLLPLVNLTNLQITSRGRVVFNVIPTGQMNSDNGVTPFSDTSFLSPEYLNSVGKKTSFSESDIEKVKYTQLSVNCK